MIGLAEEAGTGMSKILRAWRELGFRLPAIETGSERYEFTLTLRHAHLLEEDDRLWLGDLGSHWSEAEQLALVWAKREGEIDNLTLRGLTGQHSADATKVLVGLRDRGLLQKLGAKRGARYQLGPLAAVERNIATTSRAEVENAQGSRVSPGDLGTNLQGREPSSGGFKSIPGDLGVLHSASTTDAEWQELLTLAKDVRESRYVSAQVRDAVVVALCARTPLSLDEMVALLGRSEDYLRHVLRPLLASGKLAYLYPTQPSHPRQKYVAARRDEDQDWAF